MWLVAFCLTGMKCLVMGEKSLMEERKRDVWVAGDFLFLTVVNSRAKPPEFSQYSFRI